MARGYRGSTPLKRKQELHRKQLRYNISLAYGAVMERRIAGRIQESPPSQTPGEGNGFDLSD